MERISKVRWPQPMNLDPCKRDNSKWCIFDRERGHSTEDCCAFKREIEELLRCGFLRELVLNPDQRGSERAGGAAQEEKTPPCRTNESKKRKIINSVHGGTACGGERREDRRTYARIPIAQVSSARTEGSDIVFTAEDSSEVHHSHGDALVVTLDVGNCMVKRILVDNGSSADIMFLGTLEKMEISPKEIQPTRATLIGYDGNKRTAKGKIMLSITVKEETRLMEIIMVDAPLAYNLILSRPWLHSMKAVPSTYH